MPFSSSPCGRIVIQCSVPAAADEGDAALKILLQRPCLRRP
jgi:hypothetical protein